MRYDWQQTVHAAAWSGGPCLVTSPWSFAASPRAAGGSGSRRDGCRCWHWELGGKIPPRVLSERLGRALGYMRATSAMRLPRLIQHSLETSAQDFFSPPDTP